MGTEEHCKQISLACAHSVLTTLGLTCSRCVCFPSLHCSGSRLLCLQLSEAGPGLCALPRSKPFRFRFRFSGTPQRHRLSWTCVLCPSHVRAAQATRCLTSTVTPRCGVSYTSPIPAAQFAGWQQACPSQVGRVSLLGSWSLAATVPADVNRPVSQQVLVSKWEPACSFVEDASLGLRLPLSGSGCPRLPPCLWWEMGQCTAS